MRGEITYIVIMTISIITNESYSRLITAKAEVLGIFKGSGREYLRDSFEKLLRIIFAFSSLRSQAINSSYYVSTDSRDKHLFL